MAGLPGNVAWWALAKQSAKGTPNAGPPAALLPFSGGAMGPAQDTGQLAETDSSRDQGTTYISRQGAEGSPETYARDANLHTLLEAVLGTKATTGTTNYTHTVTPASALAYWTFWKMQGNLLWETYQDVMVNEMTVRAEAGSPLTVSLATLGRMSTRLTADPTIAWAGPALAGGAVYNYNEATVTLGGGATSAIRSFELAISNGVSIQQTDDVVPYDVAVGTRTVTLSFDLIFETLSEYNKFYYGGASGTVASPTIYTTSANFTFSKGANNSINFDLPSIAYEAFPVSPSVGGDPIVVSVRAQAQRGGSPVVTAVVKNQTST